MSEEAKKAEKATKEVVETAAKKTTKKKVVETKVARKEFMNTCTKFGFDTYIRF